MSGFTRSLIWINVVGGIGVLASYLWGALAQPAAMDALWGGVPPAARGLYTVNMFLAAFGYLVFTPYIVFRLCAGAAPGSLGWVRLAYLGILIPSALWLPLTAWMVDSPSVALWWAIHLDLGLVAVGSLALLVLLIRSGPGRRQRGHLAATLGALPFCLQTVVLDAIVWPLYFPRDVL
jgi:hypothetical protein